MTTHPWRLTPESEMSRSVSLLDENDQLVMMASRGDAVAMGQLHRIVACVNACAGIPTDLLTTGTIADRLAARMCDIDVSITGSLYAKDVDDVPPSGADYNLLWDAVLDEIGPALCEAIARRRLPFKGGAQ